MNEQLIQPSLELTLKLTDREANLLGAAMSKASSEEECKIAGKMLFNSLRGRESRLAIKVLGGKEKQNERQIYLRISTN